MVCRLVKFPQSAPICRHQDLCATLFAMENERLNQERKNRRQIRKQNKKAKAEEEDDEVANVKDKIGVSILFTLLGLVGLYFGAEWLIHGAVGIADSFGMEKRIIAVTVVAFGTSVPELVTSGVAAFKGETDISVGNLIGSNIFNIMAVVAVTAIVKSTAVDPNILNFDMWWMIGISAALLPLMLIGKKIGRVKGVMLVGTYVVYITLIIMSIPQ